MDISYFDFVEHSILELTLNKEYEVQTFRFYLRIFTSKSAYQCRKYSTFYLPHKLVPE